MGMALNSNHKKGVNAIYEANTPNMDHYFATYPHTVLSASGMAVGLPDGQMGNSEVGHTNIGAGRIVYQELTRITKSITDGDFFAESGTVKDCDGKLHRQTTPALHLMGLLSDGGVHSHNAHLYGLVGDGKKNGVERGLCSLLFGRQRCSAYIRQLSI